MKLTNRLTILAALLLSSTAAFAGENIDLSLVSADMVAQDGDVLTDSLTGNYRISIADGATVTLDDVIIERVNNEAQSWAGISCEGNCTIILMGSNRVKAFHQSYPGIYVPPNNTLTLKGTGSLEASSLAGAGIGGGLEIDCGNIVIESGNITASSTYTAAGIGSGQSASCQNITISGGIVSVAAGSSSAGIGSGLFGSVGNITISGGMVTAEGSVNGNGGAAIGGGFRGTAGDVLITDSVTKVSTKTSIKSAYCIGISEGSIGEITIGGVVYPDGVNDSVFVFQTYDVAFDSNGGSGTMENQRLVYERSFQLVNNKFTRKDYKFNGWNTKVDGKGDAYTDQDSVKNLTDSAGAVVTLYAQWSKLLSHSDITVDSIDEQTYTGKAITPEVVLMDGKTKLVKDTDYTVTFSDNTDVGIAKITIAGKGYYSGKIQKTFVIGKADSKLATAPSAVKGLAYTGKAQTLIKAGKAEHGTLLYKLGKDGKYSENLPTAKESGEYTVYYKVEGDSNYNGIDEKSLTAEIGKADSKLATAPSAVKGLAYTGKAQTLIKAGKAEHGTLLYKLGKDGKYSEDLPTAKKAGKYTVYYKVEGDENYNDVKENSLTVEIAEKASALVRTRPVAEQYKKEGDFDLKGRKLQGKPKARGAYYSKI